jgi:hypothetical protein
MERGDIGDLLPRISHSLNAGYGPVSQNPPALKLNRRVTS